MPKPNDLDPSQLTAPATQALSGEAPEAQGLAAAARSPAPRSPWAGGANFDAAMKQLNMNQQEQFLYGMHMQNLQAGGVPNQGKTSTLFAATFEIDGRAFVVPTVWYGKIVSPDEALQNAREVGLQNFPSYKSEGEAQARYDTMHNFMEKDLQ